MGRKFKPRLPAPGEVLYPLDGSPAVESVMSPSGLKLALYAWRVQQPKTVALFIHGVQTHARFEFLRHLNPGEPDLPSPAPPAAAAPAGAAQAAPAAAAAAAAAPEAAAKERRGRGKAKAVRPIGRQCLRWCIYEGSWVQQLNRWGCSVYAGDLQSFGLSEGWKGRRCSVERLDNFAMDVIAFAEFVAADISARPATGGSPAPSGDQQPPPIYLVGISMGGFSVIRALEIMGETHHWLVREAPTSEAPHQEAPAAPPRQGPPHSSTQGAPVEPPEGAPSAALSTGSPSGTLTEAPTGAPSGAPTGAPSGASDDIRPRIVGCVALAPMLSIEKASSGAYNRTMTKVGGVLSRVAPHLGVVKVPPARLPWVDDQKNEDPLVTCPLKIPARLAAEVMAAVPRVHLNAKFIPLHIALLIIHAREDSIVEPQGSIRFMNESGAHIQKRRLDILEGERGHYLVIEPGNDEVLAAIKEWLRL
ncbi:hypothetical protein, conserved [Eimeria tenella]|uniref:Serine aminopeptidase S33 domain-containing protein n=1 Tax=Eimeria tenella TaxID=5802 RepID=U6KNV6_EIMTE|nr:hypothetical protein, conserved [Eimeria tenella]CDJ38501.1 hypothetical protein, conserved [Eimeria tenella]|eukprot:XP_013229339.1 hypothetical protein, conserved [Eimeria tenella]